MSTVKINGYLNSVIEAENSYMWCIDKLTLYVENPDMSSVNIKIQSIWLGEGFVKGNKLS